MDSLKYGRNEGRKTGGSVDNEVQKLLQKNGKVTGQDFLNLRKNLKDEEIVDKIQSAYIELTGDITKKAKKFAQLIREKYSDSNTPFHILLEKAYKYKVKYGLTDNEFAEFQRIYEQELVGSSKPGLTVQPFTNVQKVLGGMTLDFTGFTGKLEEKDQKVLAEVMNLEQNSKPLHAQVLLQAIKYKDMEFEAMTGDYERNMHSVGEHIHPVVAALFLPKFKIIDEHFLFSNMANIIKRRFKGEPLMSRPDYELFWALTTDPNDVVCDNKSTMLDLFNRAQVQVQLWNCVLNLRQGKYYNSSFKDFLNSVDICRLNKQDTPDLVYGRYDGVVLKRLLSAFSFRPTTVATTPYLASNMATNPYSFNIVPEVTSIPMINVRMPPKIQNAGAIRLDSALQSFQFFINGGQIIPKNISLIWSRGVLIFYVDRRAVTIPYNNQHDAFTMNKLPTPISGFERLNDRDVEFDSKMSIGTTEDKNEFQLRSVVFSEVNTLNPTDKNVVIGSSALLVKPEVAGIAECFYCYDPYGPVNTNGGVGRKVISRVYKDQGGNNDQNFTYLAKKQGVIFVYANDKEDTLNVARNMSIF